LRSFSASVLLGACLWGCSPPKSPPLEDRLLVGAAAVEITPAVETFEDANGNGRYDPGEAFQDLDGDGKWTPTYLAGFGTNRVALGVHDPLWARAVVFEKRGRRVTLVSCDLVGLLHARVRTLTSAIGGAGELIVCSTHCHSGPDVVGLWGPLPMISGVSGATLKRLRDGLAEAVRRAVESRRPASLRAAEAKVEGVCKDIRPPDIRNEVATSLVARDDAGRPIVVLVNFAMHPEGMGSKNRMISSDFPHYVREAVERDFPGAVAVYISGDLGGMQTPDVKEKTWEEIRRCGETIAARVRESQAAAEGVDVPEVKVARANVRFPLENDRFVGGFKSGLFGPDSQGVVVPEGDGFVLTSEVVVARLGSVEMVTVPGEALPEVGREIYKLMEAPHRLLIGLGQDEIGYILPKEDFNPKKYEESMSLGPRTAPTLLDALKPLLKGF
jgi:hypothetical protein